jgi:hypothetical protein
MEGKRMKTYAFTIKCVGKGDTLKDAWQDAKQTLEQELDRHLAPEDCEPELIEDDEDSETDSTESEEN